MEPVNTLIILLLAANLVGILIVILKLNKKNDTAGEEIRRDIARLEEESFTNMNASMHNISQIMVSNQQAIGDMQEKRLAEMNRQLLENSMKSEQQLENIRGTVERQLGLMNKENSRQLEQMRATVDEKLQRTLNARITESFKIVNDRLEQVYKGLGEMQTLASSVGDIKKVLSNVKTRGIMGEVQLGAILEQIMSPSQYDENVNTTGRGRERVEFAIKLPGPDEDGFVYLPIDAKFPAETYSQLLDAYDTEDKVHIEAAYKNLERVIKSEAKDIRDKYIEPPKTTDFGIMFLPFEGLYAEVVRRGLVETLQNQYKVNVAGPTTMAALLNSLQLGFKTLAIQKHSGEVWKVLGSVKTEFEKFGEVLEAAKNKINQANTELDKLIGVRTRQIQKTLADVSSLEADMAGDYSETEE